MSIAASTAIETNTFADAIAASIGLVRHCQYSGSVDRAEEIGGAVAVLDFPQRGFGAARLNRPHVSAKKCNADEGEKRDAWGA
jgi:hypothetical protein